ncbi:flavin reductase family protein [Nocardioides sp. SOB77]|uniref:Flavin reductase family protein n=1 Tax=Nocardioides oceani TaxID=3058369 RepID=A0ABT8FI59_9ACTN|nr:flavin reductase family protein [Nocardioides oceani]MDN4174077.1 flavin reductase family protein [Nocardioides oceani]
MDTAERTVIDPAHYREVMGHYPTGVAVVTGTVDGEPVGMVVGTFSSVSIDPPLVAFMPQVGSRTWDRLAGADALCVNVLAHDQLALCRTMAVSKPDKFDDVAWSPSATGAPVLADAVAHVHCRTASVMEAGDHWIVLCAVDAMEVTRPATPLLFFQGGYGGFSPTGMAARGDGDLIAAVRLGDRARTQVERLATSLGCEAAALVAVSPDELTTAVSAYGGTATMVEPLGQRIPLIPPIGEAYVAGAAPDVVERWLAKVTPHDPELVACYRKRLDTVAANGVALSMVGPGARADYDRMHDALAEYASGELTPARERAVRSVLAQTRHFFDDVEVLPDETYDVGAVVVPVHGPDGRVAMVLRATQLPTGVPGRVVTGWIDRVRTAARCVERDLATGGGADRASDYRAWYEADFPM